MINVDDEKVKKWTYTFDKDSIDRALFYRTNSYLWEKLINQAKNRQLPIKEIVFDTSKSKSKYSAVENLKWKSGYVRLDKFIINTFDKEEYLIFTWIDDDWNKIEQEIFEKMFLISWIEQDISFTEEIKQKLEKLKEQNISQFQETSTKNNYDYFQQEIEKLEAWESDMKFNLKQELEELKQEYNEKKKEAMMIWVKDIQKKLELEKEAMKLNKKYNEKQKSYWDEIDKIEKEKWRLIENLQQKMNAGSEEENLFIVRWKVI